MALNVRVTHGSMVRNEDKDEIFIPSSVGSVTMDIDKVRGNVAEMIAGLDTQRIDLVMKDNRVVRWERVGW